MKPISFNCWSSVEYRTAGGRTSAGAPMPPPIPPIPPIPCICINYCIIGSFIPPMPPMPPIGGIPPPGIYIEPGIPLIAPIPGGPPFCIICIAAFMFSGVIIACIICGLVSIALSCGFYWVIYCSIGFDCIILFMNSGLESIYWTIGLFII